MNKININLPIYRQIANEIILHDQQNIDILINDCITVLDRKRQAIMKLEPVSIRGIIIYFSSIQKSLNLVVCIPV